jgi:hypothetical protein
MEKRFYISRDGDSVNVVGMGRIMFRPEAGDIVGRFGSIIKGDPGESIVDIVPPIKKDRLDELGGALVELAKMLDPNPPDPDHKIQ